MRARSRSARSAAEQAVRDEQYDDYLDEESSDDDVVLTHVETPRSKAKASLAEAVRTGAVVLPPNIEIGGRGGKSPGGVRSHGQMMTVAGVR